MTLHRMEARGIRVTLDLAEGQMATFEVLSGSRVIAPFARVPWADAVPPVSLPPDAPPHLRAMSGDFFCAPFCADDVERTAPLHGWTANSAWDLIGVDDMPGGQTCRFRLRRKVAGATVEKVWRLRDDHPFLYQRHDFIGGRGAIPVAHHAMIDLRSGGHLRFSPKLWAETPDTGLEPGRSLLAYPAEGTDLSAFPGETGPVDLLRWPIGRRHEDFVMLIDDPAGQFGWATALRPAHGDAALLVKPVAQLPQTMLWMSNGGRDRAPWGGRHVGVLGIEEACALGGEGWAASAAANRLTARGIATAVDLGEAPVVSIATALGALPTGATAGLDLAIRPDSVMLSDGSVAPFDADWLTSGPADAR